MSGEQEPRGYLERAVIAVNVAAIVGLFVLPVALDSQDVPKRQMVTTTVNSPDKH